LWKEEKGGTVLAFVFIFISSYCTHRNTENFANLLQITGIELMKTFSFVLVYLDGTKSQEELLSYVYSDVIQEFKKLREGSK